MTNELSPGAIGCSDKRPSLTGESRKRVLMNFVMKVTRHKQCLLICLVSIWIKTVNAEIQVSVYDQDNNPVNNAVVSVHLADSTASSELSDQMSMQIMDQRNKQFLPYVLPVRVGTPVNFPNSDNIRHQVYSFSAAKTFKLPLYHDTPAEPVIFDKPGVVILGCNIHDQMVAYIYVVDTKYFEKVEQGKAIISGLDTGQYEVTLWHPALANPVENKAIDITDKNSLDSLIFNVDLQETTGQSPTLTPLEEQFKELLRETN